MWLSWAGRHSDKKKDTSHLLPSPPTRAKAKKDACACAVQQLCHAVMWDGTGTSCTAPPHSYIVYCCCAHSLYICITACFWNQERRSPLHSRRHPPLPLLFLEMTTMKKKQQQLLLLLSLMFLVAVTAAAVAADPHPQQVVLRLLSSSPRHHPN